MYLQLNIQSSQMLAFLELSVIICFPTFTNLSTVWPIAHATNPGMYVLRKTRKLKHP